MADEWQPANDVERALLDAMQRGEQDRYFEVLSAADLILPFAADASGAAQPGTWATWGYEGRTYILAFSSQQALASIMGRPTDQFRTGKLAEICAWWPDESWWLAVDFGLPIAGYLPGTFVSQLTGVQLGAQLAVGAAAPTEPTAGYQPGQGAPSDPAPGAQPDAAPDTVSAAADTVHRPRAEAAQAPGPQAGAGGQGPGAPQPGGAGANAPAQAPDAAGAPGDAGTAGDAPSQPTSAQPYQQPTSAQPYQQPTSAQPYQPTSGQPYQQGGYQQGGVQPYQPAGQAGQGYPPADAAAQYQQQAQQAAPAVQPGGEQPGTAPMLSNGQTAAGFQPANPLEQTLLDASRTGDRKTFMDALLGAYLLVPVPEGASPGPTAVTSPDFPWPSIERNGTPQVPVFTSQERLRERVGAAPYAVVPFVLIVEHWPHREWYLALNPDTPVSATVDGDQIAELAEWARRTHLAERLGVLPPQHAAEQAPVVPPQSAPVSAQPAPADPSPWSPSGRSGPGEREAGAAADAVPTGAGPDDRPTDPADQPDAPADTAPADAPDRGAAASEVAQAGDASRSAADADTADSGVTGDDHVAVTDGPEPGEAGAVASGGADAGAAVASGEVAVEAGSTDPVGDGTGVAGEPAVAGGEAATDDEAGESAVAGGEAAADDGAGEADTAGNADVPGATTEPAAATAVPDDAARDDSHGDDAALADGAAESGAHAGDASERAGVAAASAGDAEQDDAEPAPEWPPVPPAIEDESTPAAEPVPPLSFPALLQKVLPDAQVPFYLERHFDRVGGWIHQAADAPVRSGDLRVATGLASEAAEEPVHAIRWHVEFAALLPVLEAVRSAADPELAEYRVGTARLPHGAELYRIDPDGETTVLAVFNADHHRWHPLI